MIGWLGHCDIDPEAPVVICFPPGGTGGLYFRDFSVDGAVVVSMAYPGRDVSRVDRLATSIRELATLAEMLLTNESVHRIGLVGVSMGSLVAYELATRLVDAGYDVESLVLCASAAPGCESPVGTYAAMRDQEFAFALSKIDLSDGGALMDREVQEFVMPRLRNDFRMCAEYRGPDSASAVLPFAHVIGGSYDAGVPANLLESWSDFIDAYDICLLNGDHGVFRQNLSTIAEKVSRDFHRHTSGRVRKVPQ